MSVSGLLRVLIEEGPFTDTLMEPPPEIVSWVTARVFPPSASTTSHIGRLHVGTTGSVNGLDLLQFRTVSDALSRVYATSASRLRALLRRDARLTMREIETFKRG
jgi:hypothetical protein